MGDWIKSEKFLLILIYFIIQNTKMYLQQQILFIPLLLFSQIRFNRSEFNEVRDFAEEVAKAAKGMTLTDLSNYFVDFAHLNGQHFYYSSIYYGILISNQEIIEQ